MINRLDIGAALDWEGRLFEEVAKRPEKRFLQVWSSEPSLVSPKKLSTLPGYPDAAREMAKAGWPVHLRATGGDVTPQGPGIVNVTHVYTHASGGAFDIEAAYGRLCQPIVRALGGDASIGWQPGAFCDGAYNVQWAGLKFAGTAMRFRPSRADKSSHTVLAHALMLFEPPSGDAIAAVNRFLSLLGEPRTIDPTAHTGLPDGLRADQFLKRLRSEFDAPTG